MTPATCYAPLNDASLLGTPALAPRYDRGCLQRRILHIGPGAFFRAHQADYIDRLNALEPVWGIVGLSLRSGDVPRALSPQDGLYTLVTLDETVAARIIGALIEVIDVTDADLVSVLCEPDLRLVTLTVTEKGYCQTASGALDMDHPDIRADVQSPRTPTSAIGWLVHLLSLRRQSGQGAPIILSCDNLPANGAKLQASVLALAAHQSTDLADWISANARFPSSMVDSITPATTDRIRQIASGLTKLHDAWPVQREAFADWVIESVGDDARMPPLDRVGAVFTHDVHGYEQAKLRLLNGAHSTIAYYGLAKGYATVAEAMRDGELTAQLRAMMTDEIAASLSPVPGLDLQTYIDALLKRFANLAMAHQLSQIAWDGSQKLPIRLVATVMNNLEAGRPVDRLCLGLAAWWRFVIRQVRSGQPLVDPLAARLSGLVTGVQDEAEHDLGIMLAIDEVFPAALIADDGFTRALATAYAHILSLETPQMRRSPC